MVTPPPPARGLGVHLTESEKSLVSRTPMEARTVDLATGDAERPSNGASPLGTPPPLVDGPALRLHH